MPAAGGPNTLGESNLVFAYDTGDVSNSYKGQPTVNVLPSSNVLLTSYNDHGGTHVTDTGFTLFGNATLRNTSNPAQDWNGVYLTGLSSILTPGVTYTYSFYIYFTSDNTTISYFGYGAPGYTGVKGQWNRVSTTFTATSQDYFYVTLQYSNGQPVSTYYLANLQIEQKSNPTQFVNGTRSATQGLLPLVGNSTIDLSNVSFDSSAKMVFDGTNDYLEFPAITLSGDFTISQVVTLQSTTNGPMPIGGGFYTNGSTYLGYVWFRGGANEVILAVDGEQTVIFSVNSSLWANKTVIYTIRRSGSTATLYINGDEIATGTISLNNFNVRTIGYSYSFSYASLGTIDNTFIYNKALTAQEIQQNYQQYKTRFNLS